jgi:hypothetical protein
MAKPDEQKREDFQRMLGGRLPKAVKAVELLGNLARTADYKWTNAELQDMVDQLDGAVDGVLSAFGIPADEPGDIAKPIIEAKKASIVATRSVTVSANREPVEVRAEVRWAHDALQMNDPKLAKNRLARVIQVWIDEEKRL